MEQKKEQKLIVDYDNLITDRSKEVWFLGSYSGFQRYDYVPYPFIEKLSRMQLNQMWFPEEVALHEDKRNFIELPECNQEHIKLNLTFQTLMDSSQERSLGMSLIPSISSPTLEECIKIQEFFELIHSKSYSHIIREMFDRPTELFDKYAKYPEIKHRTKEEIDCYQQFMINNASQSDDNKRLLLRLCFRIQLLEGVKFYVSFLVTLLINRYAGRGNMIPNVAKIIKLINADEDFHLMIFSYILQTLRKEEHQGFTHLFTPEMEKLFHNDAIQVYNDELNWAKYLMSHGEIPGMSEKGIEEFLQFYIDDRLKKCGTKPIFGAAKNDLVREYVELKDINNTNTALQESTNISYAKGNIHYDTRNGLISSLEEEIEGMFK